MLSAITYAREHDLAYLGTCGGFQYALIEFTRNVLGVADADSAEHNPTGQKHRHHACVLRHTGRFARCAAAGRAGRRSPAAGHAARYVVR
jgi:CTP synthase (UTP-ammonia lyase)